MKEIKMNNFRGYYKRDIGNDNNNQIYYSPSKRNLLQFLSYFLTLIFLGVSGVVSILILKWKKSKNKAG